MPLGRPRGDAVARTDWPLKSGTASHRGAPGHPSCPLASLQSGATVAPPPALGGQVAGWGPPASAGGVRGTLSLRLTWGSPPRKGTVPHSGAARGLGQGPVGGRLPEQQRLPQQPQVLAAGLRTQRGIRGRPAETAAAHGGPPRQGLPGRGPAPLEGNPPGPSTPLCGMQAQG